MPGRWSKALIFGSAAVAPARSSCSASWPRRRGILVEVVEPVVVAGEIVSSSRVRRLVADGQVGEARQLLTEPYRVRGMVVHGGGPWREDRLRHRQRRRDRYDYAGQRRLRGPRVGRAIGCGRPRSTSVPIRHSASRLPKVEAHLIGWHDPLYGYPIELDFLERLRGVQRFAGVAELRAQLARDVAAARAIVAAAARIAAAGAPGRWRRAYLDADIRYVRYDRRDRAPVAAADSAVLPAPAFGGLWFEASRCALARDRPRTHRVANYSHTGGHCIMSFATHPLDSVDRPREPRPMSVETIRVLHLINGEHYSGTESVQDLLALGLPEFGFEAAFACLKPGRFPECRRSQETPLWDVSMRSRFDLGIARRIARLVRQGDYRLIHSHTPRAALVGRIAAGLAGVPMVYHLHSPTAADSTHRLRNRLNAATEHWSLARVAAVIAVSHSLAEYARQKRIAPGRVHVVPNGVPVVGRLSPRTAPIDVWTLGIVALFRPRKGLEVLLDALSQARAAGLPVRLRAIGGFETPDYHTQILAQVERLGSGRRHRLDRIHPRRSGRARTSSIC